MNTHRVRTTGDNWSLDTFGDPSIESILVFVHGIFGDHKESWGTIPTELMTAPAFYYFDWASFGYTTKLVHFKNPSLFAEQLDLWLETKLSKYNNIFIVAHSLGGLLVRHAIILSLTNRKPGWVTKLRKYFLIASPVTGAWIARIGTHIPVIRALNNWLPYLARPTVNGELMNKVYERVFNEYCEGKPERSASLPHSHLFLGTEDWVTLKPQAWRATDFDHYEGAIAGGHSTMKEGLKVDSVLLERIIQLVQDSTALSESSQMKRIDLILKSTKSRGNALIEKPFKKLIINPNAIDVLLISCSGHKSDNKGELYKSNGIVRQLSDPAIEQLILQRRSKILKLIHEGRINGIEFHEGNRAAMPANRSIKMGPDFGGVINKDVYLPAYQRYRGRCYIAEDNEWKNIEAENSQTKILIMSGMYGLIKAHEYIQNYDCHLTDVDTESGISVQSYWKDRELMTLILISHLEWLEKNYGPIRNVVDVLSEISYQETINWQLIYPRWNVFHRIFEKNTDRAALENMGPWIQQVLRGNVSLAQLKHDEFLPIENTIDGDRIAFESRIGNSPLEHARKYES